MANSSPASRVHPGRFPEDKLDACVYWLRQSLKYLSTRFRLMCATTYRQFVAARYSRRASCFCAIEDSASVVWTDSWFVTWLANATGLT